MLVFRVILDMAHAKIKVTRWFRLLDAEEMHDEESPMGELELSLQWIHDPRSKEIAKKNMSLLEIVQRTLGTCVFLCLLCLLFFSTILLFASWMSSARERENRSSRALIYNAEVTG